jgi:vitamin B12 transporter
MRVLAALILTSAFPASAIAQQQDTAKLDSLPNPTSIAPVYVTASRLPLRSDRLGFSMTAIRSKQLEAHHAMYLSDALRSLSGTHIEEATGPGGPTIVRLRGGEEVFTQILLDGVQLNQNGGFFDFQGLMLTNVARIEVLRGPQSALYGSTAMSGVVQMFTPRGEAGQTHASAMVEGGTGEEHGGAYRGSADVSGGTEQFRYSAGAARGFTRGTYSLPHNLRSNEASLRFDYLPSQRWAATAIGRFMGIDSKLPVRDPGATRVPLDPTAYNTRDRLVTSLGVEFKPSETHTHTLRAMRYGEDFIYEDSRDGVAADMYDFFVFDANILYTSKFSRIGAEYVGRYHPNASRFAVSYGLQTEREALTESASGDFGPSSLEVARNSGAAFGEARLTPTDRLEILAGARVEKFEDLEAELTPRASATFQLVADRVMLRASAAAGFKAPNLQQEYAASAFIAPNRDIRPETSTSYEAGLDVRSADGARGVTVTAFTQNFTDLIRTVALEGTDQQINRNLGRSRAQGMELTLTAQPSQRVGGSIDVIWMRTEILDNTGLSPAEFPVGESLPFRPGLAASAELRVAPLQRLGLALRASVLGTQWVLTERFSGQRVELAAHALAGMTAAYEFDHGVGVMLRIENLTNAQYEAAYDRRGAGRFAALSVRVHR